MTLMATQRVKFGAEAPERRSDYLLQTSRRCGERPQLGPWHADCDGRRPGGSTMRAKAAVRLLLSLAIIGPVSTALAEEQRSDLPEPEARPGGAALARR